MASVGIWLWSRPANFGAPSCDPSLVIVGGACEVSREHCAICHCWCIPSPHSWHQPCPASLFPSTTYPLQQSPEGNTPSSGHDVKVESTYLDACDGFWTVFSGDTCVTCSIKRLNQSVWDRIAARRKGSRCTNKQSSPMQNYFLPTNKAHTAFLVVGLMCLAFINSPSLPTSKVPSLTTNRFESGERMSGGLDRSLRYFFSSFHCEL